ncbi:uncharacterized protein LOC143300466 isoform X2 [Babylonia areolata]|uniref:uncharacterized protein LOC143300466 isoform X2 n=1 Tax=Babylonia areolata TaxID=304850 RepID=UPI003FD12CB3
MERLTTSSESHSTCLTLCYQSLQGAVSQMGVDNQSSTIPQMTLESASPASLTHLTGDGSAGTGVAQLRIETPGLGVDSQAAMAVQSLLESQQPQDNTVEEEDLFRCGRCKKQFTALTMFLAHKQNPCAPTSIVTGPLPQTAQLQLPLLEEQPQQQQHQQHQHQQHQHQQALVPQQQLQHQQPLQQLQQIHQVQSVGQVANGAVKTVLPPSHTNFSNTICSVTQQGQPLSTFTTVPTSPLSHLPQGVVLTDDLMTFANIDPAALQGSTIQMVAAPFNTRSTNNVTIVSTVQPTTTFAPQGSNPFQQTQQQQQQQQHHQQQQQPQLTQFTPQQTLSANSQLTAFSSQPNVAASLSSFPQQSMQTVTQQPTPQPITITLPEKPTAQTIAVSLPEKQPHAIIRRTPTKAGRKSSQSQAAANAGIVNTMVTGGAGTRRGGKGGSSTGEEKPRTLQCQYCSKLFLKNFDLQQHVRAHTGEKPFQCIVCGRAFAQKSNVKKHMATHKVWPSGTSSTLPKQPPPEAMAAGEVEGEMEEQQSGGEAVVEAVGREQGEGEGQQEGVVITVSDQQQVLVKEDPDTGSVDKEEEREVALGGSGSQQLKVKVVVDNSYICQYCSEKFKTFFQLKTHMVKHKSEQVYKCVMKKCGQSFKDLEAFLEHIKTHENEMTYRCHQCNKYFPSLYELGCHQYSHNLFPAQGMKSGPRHFQCTKCGNKYTTPEALEHHMATTSHQYPCPHCNKVFTCERFLRRHLPIHGSEGQFVCTTCEKRFKTEHYLKSHQLIHTGEMPYQCETCPAAFNRKDKLKRHMTIHETVKKYRCPFKSLTGCPKEFNRPDKLKSHIITHSGIKPFKCSVCGKGFSRRPHMMEHERGHKSDYRFKCEKCGRGFFRAKLYNEHKCQPGRAAEPQLFRPRRRRRKIGRPRKRVLMMAQEELLQEEASEVGAKPQHHQSTPGLRSSSGIRLRNARVAAAIASQMKGSGRSRGGKSAGGESSGTDQMSTEKEGVEMEEQDEGGVPSEQEQLEQLATLHEKQLVTQVLPGELDDSQVIDHYVVHLTECSEGGVPTLHTSLTPATLQAGLAAGTLQPITIIEATSVQMAGVGVGAGAVGAGMMETGGLPVMAVSQGGEVMATQVVVASDSPSQQQTQTFVTCPTQLVDLTAGDPVLQGTESLLKASAEILQTAAQADDHTLHNP